MKHGGLAEILASGRAPYARRTWQPPAFNPACPETLDGIGVGDEAEYRRRLAARGIAPAGAAEASLDDAESTEQKARRIAQAGAAKVWREAEKQYG